MNCADCKYSHDTGTALLCWGERFAPPVDKDHWCEGWKPKNVAITNLEWLRMMDADELADWFADLEIKAYKRCGYKGNRERFKEQWLTWLNGPVKEEE